MTTKEFRDLRLKDDITAVENLMLLYRSNLITISEILSSYRKGELEEKTVISNIGRQVADVVNYL